jgi:two-component system sensor histidine kinase KdpD
MIGADLSAASYRPFPFAHFPAAWQNLGMDSLTRLLRYFQAVAVVVVSTAVLYLLQASLVPSLVALLYLLPVVISTIFWGLGPGITAAIAAFLAFNFYFIEPYYTFNVQQSQDELALFIFLMVAAVITNLVARTQTRAQTSLAEARAREYEATHLYELSTSLVGLREQEAIARILAEHIRQVFQAQVVAIAIQGGKERSVLYDPAVHAPLRDKITHVTPLITTHGLLGEIRLWREERPLTTNEERLLQTFASQGALALEYALLADADTRATVLEESDRLKSALLSSVSHELRTPLATIKAAATSLLGEEANWDAAARHELLTAIASESDHLNRLVGNLLDMSRIEAGALKPQRQWNILADIVGEVIGRMRGTAVSHYIKVNVPDDLPLLPVDHVQMDQVFTNLLSNCLKYAPPQTTIQVRAWLAGEQVQVQVSNEGPPVPEEQLEQIFNKFYRATAVSHLTGSGLGLSICKGIIEAHDGRIWAENLPGGFAFHFTLPTTWEGRPPPKLPIV